MTSEYQKELFGEFKSEKGKLKKIADKITQRQHKFYVNVPLENMVVGVIVAIMCIIVAFALGTERGKRLAERDSKKSVMKKTVTESPKVDKVAAIPAPVPLNEVEKVLPEEKIQSAELPYTIQLIAYKKEEIAQKEKNKLLNKDVNAFIIPSGSWYQVCAGSFGTVDEAKKAMASFKNDYKGCFIRRRK